MRFVFKHNQVITVALVRLNPLLDGAGVDFLGIVKIAQHARALCFAHIRRRKVHQAYVPLPAHLSARIEVILIHVLCFPRDRVVRKFYLVKLGGKRRVAAVVRPVCIQHLKLGNRRIALFGFEIVLRAQHVLDRHGEAVFRRKVRDLFFVHLDEAIHHGDLRGNTEGHFERIKFLERGLARIHRIDYVFFDCFKLLFIDILDKINFCKTYIRAFLARQKLYALRRAVCALVILSGQVFHRKYGISLFVGHLLISYRIHRRFAEHADHRRVKIRIVDSFHVVTV